MTDRLSTALLVTSGDGPEECHQAVKGIVALMQQEADANAVDLDVSKTRARHGLKSAVVILHGPGSAAFAARWVGTIRWRAQSQLRPKHRRKNWFIGVFQLQHSLQRTASLAPSDVSYESFRAGGPGGQHQNTTDSAVRATHRPTGLTAVAREERSQHRNKALAFARLGQLMAAQAMADQQAQEARQNKMHHAVERGNPVRCFKGPSFAEEGGTG